MTQKPSTEEQDRKKPQLQKRNDEDFRIKRSRGKTSQIPRQSHSRNGRCYEYRPGNHGDRLGLYKAMAGAGNMRAKELAGKTGTDGRYVQEWLSAQAAGGFIQYHPESQTFSLPGRTSDGAGGRR